MGDGGDHTPSGETIKLIIDKALLESEARSASSLSTTLADQNKIYMTEIVKVTADIATLNEKTSQNTEKIKGFKWIIVTVSSATTALGGMVGFFIAQLTSVGGK